MLYSEKGFGYFNVGCVAQQSQNTRERLLDENIEQVQSKYSDLKSKIGVFEGTGYKSKGLYRSEVRVGLFLGSEKRYNRLCQEAILHVIDHLSN